MNEHPISLVVDSVEQALENAHRGLAVARDVRFAAEGGLLALRALDVATKTLRSAMKGETIVEDVEPEQDVEPDVEDDAPQGTVAPTRVQTNDPIGYAVKVIRYAKSQGLSVRDMGEVVGISGETIRRYAFPGTKSPTGSNKRPKTAQRIVEALVAFTGYNRKATA